MLAFDSLRGTFHFAVRVGKVMWRFQIVVVRVGVQSGISLIVHLCVAKLTCLELRIRVWRGTPVFVSSRILIRRFWNATSRLTMSMPHFHISSLLVSPPLPPLSLQLLQASH